MTSKLKADNDPKEKVGKNIKNNAFQQIACAPLPLTSKTTLLMTTKIDI